MSETVYKELTLDDLYPDLLMDFDRYQETTRVWAVENHSLHQKDDTFIDEWGVEKKRKVVKDMEHYLQTGGFVVGAFTNSMLKGFACVEGEFFGSRNQYLDMPYIHVSRELRGKGVGRRLFAMCAERAKQIGASKLYISTHPSIESQAFYRSMGCVLAEEINQAIYESEPLDLQLEYQL